MNRFRKQQKAVKPLFPLLLGGQGWTRGERSRLPVSTTARRVIPAVKSSHAFTLLEVLVTAVILGILLVLVIVGGAKVVELNEISQTRATVHQAMGANTEYTAQTGQVINHDGTTPIDWTVARGYTVPGTTGSGVINDTDPANQSIERFVWAIDQVPEAEMILRTINEDFRTDRDGDNFLELRDAWDNNLLYGAYLIAADGSPYSRLQPRGSINDPRPFVASAGPDGVFGTTDDIFSFDLD